MVRKTIAELVKACDVFAQPAAFRFGDEPEYESLTGGTCSIIMIIAFIIIFTNTVLSTIRKQKIDSKVTTLQDEDPTFYQVGTNSFMFAVGLTGTNMNGAAERWFDVYMQKTQIINRTNKTKELVSMQPCTKQQWTRINANMSNDYDRIGLDSWQCPPDGLTIELQGKYTSSMFKYIKFGVKKCNSSLDPTRPCASNTTLDQYLAINEVFTFNFYFVNQIINPTNAQFLSTYLDDFNYFPFTQTDGLSANFYLSSFEINTDESIYPVSNMTNTTGGISTTPAQTLNYKVRQKDYFKFYIRKSSLSLIYERSYTKIDDTFSYIGGLFSAIVTALLLMKKYNEISYELEIAKTLYHYNKNEPLKSDQFNIFVFLGYLIYAFFETICIKLPWNRMKVYFHSLEEVRKQMDIRLVMKKVLYSQRMAIAVFDEPKAKILHLQEPLTLEEAEKIRKDHLLYDKLAKKYFDYDKIREDSQQQLVQNEKQQLFEMNLGQNTEDIIMKKKSTAEISIDDIIFKQSASSHNSIKEKDKEHETAGKNGLSKTLKNNVLNLISVFMDDEAKKEQEFNRMIVKVKEYVRILIKQSQQGDQVSRKILDRFDPKLIKLLLLPEKSKQTYKIVQLQANPISSFTINLQSKS